MVAPTESTHDCGLKQNHMKVEIKNYKKKHTLDLHLKTSYLNIELVTIKNKR